VAEQEDKRVNWP